MIEPVIRPDETVRIEKGDTKPGDESWRRREPWTTARAMELAGRGIVVIVVTLLVVAIIGACAFTAFEAWAWALNG